MDISEESYIVVIVGFFSSRACHIVAGLQPEYIMYSSDQYKCDHFHVVLKVRQQCVRMYVSYVLMTCSVRPLQILLGLSDKCCTCSITRLLAGQPISAI